MLFALIAMTAALVFVLIQFRRTLIRRSSETNKFKYFNDVYSRWLKNRNDNKYLADYLKAYGYNTVAVYGLGKMGQRLCEELSDSDVKIRYIIDNYTTNTFKNIKIYKLISGLEPVDVIIVTVSQEYEKIENELRNILSYPVLALDSIIYGL